MRVDIVHGGVCNSAVTVLGVGFVRAGSQVIDRSAWDRHRQCGPGNEPWAPKSRDPTFSRRSRDGSSPF